MSFNCSGIGSVVVEAIPDSKRYMSCKTKSPSPHEELIRISHPKCAMFPSNTVDVLDKVQIAVRVVFVIWFLNKICK